MRKIGHGKKRGFKDDPPRLRSEQLKGWNVSTKMGRKAGGLRAEERAEFAGVTAGYQREGIFILENPSRNHLKQASRKTHSSHVPPVVCRERHSRCWPESQ